MRPFVLACLAASLAAPTSLYAAATAAELTARLDAARVENRLTDPALKPWHLAVSFDLLDKVGTVQEHGTIDELWSAPDHYRLSITSPSYTTSTTRLGSEVFRTGSADLAPWLVDTLLTELLDPIPGASNTAILSPTFSSLRVGSANLDCIMRTPTDRPSIPPLGTHPTFCFEPGQPGVRIILNYVGEQIVRNRMGRFQGKPVAQSISIVEENTTLLRATIDALTGASAADMAFTAPPGQPPISIPAELDRGEIAGHLLNRVPPEYPLQARYDHVSGSVALDTVIGVDGHVTSLRVRHSTSPLLSESALKAVHQWVYEPFLLNGKPTEVRTQITVNYAMAR